MTNTKLEGILLIDKPKGITSFTLVKILRNLTNIKKIGHAGTLDPSATGLMIMLIGKKFTSLSNKFLNSDKEYIAQIHLGISTDTFDSEGEVTSISIHTPSKTDLSKAINSLQGPLEQIPPMFSAKKVKGQKLYHLARAGKTIDRLPNYIYLKTHLLSYHYPFLELKIECSKGTYIRSIAHDIGTMLNCGAHLANLRRTRSGNLLLKDALDGKYLKSNNALDVIKKHLIYTI